MTRRDRPGDEPVPPDPAAPQDDAGSPAQDAPTTELSAADLQPTQDWPAPGAADGDATRERAALGGDGPGEPAAPGDPSDADAPDAPLDAGAPGAYAALDDDAPVAPPAPASGAGEALRDWPAGDTRETRIVSPAERDRAPDPLPSTDFPIAWRGYDVHAVDAYVAAAEAAIASFEERTLPTVAVQRALDRVGEQTASILREAEQAAEETARVSRAQADDRLQRAEREAAAIRQAAETRVRDLDDAIERLWQERQRLIDATLELADRLRRTAEEAEARFPPAATADAPSAPSPTAALGDEPGEAAGPDRPA